MPIQPIKRRAISEDVTRNILESIRNRELKPGDKLPSERQLAEEFQVSRVSLREGMRTLAYMNIVEIRTGDGTYVSDLKPETLVEHLEFVLSLDDSTLHQLLEARQFVEPQLAALAATNITDEELALLNLQLQKMRAVGDDFEQISELDVQLHMIIAQASRNPFLIRFMASLRHLGHKSRQRTSQIDFVRQISQKDHEQIVAAINAGDADGARDAMTRHLQHIQEGLIQDNKNNS